MLGKNDREILAKAVQSASLLVNDLKELAGASNPFLVEHALLLIKEVADVQAKLERIYTNASFDKERLHQEYDHELLEKAVQSASLFMSDLKDLVAKANDPILSDYALALSKDVVDVQTKLERVLAISSNEEVEDQSYQERAGM